jgi:hypothetical protein
MIAARRWAWLGAELLARWPKRRSRQGSAQLLAAAFLMSLSQLQLFPGGGAELGVRGVRLAIAVSVNFMLGALMTLGIGLYAPCMILVPSSGMSPTAAFPIMMVRAPSLCRLADSDSFAKKLRFSNLGGLDFGRYPRRAACRLLRRKYAALRGALARHRSRHLHRDSHAVAAAPQPIASTGKA